MFKKKKILSTFLILLTLFVSTSVNASPIIAGINGNIIAGNNIVIVGTDFGTKSPAEPILWDNFEDGSDGDLLTTSPKGWNAYRFGGGFFESEEAYSGTLSAYNEITVNEDTSGRTNYYTFDEINEGYYTYRTKLIYTNGGDRDVIKNGRLTSSSDHYSTIGGVSISDKYAFYGTGTGSKYHHKGHWASGVDEKFSDIMSSSWVRHELYRKHSTPGYNDGAVYARVGDEEAWDDSAMTTASGYSFGLNSVLLGLETYNQKDPADNYKMYVDDVYVDNTRSRVELCSGSTWANRGECDPQIPVEWSTNSITATVNKGVFENGDIVYLYIVDENGDTNSNGYLITIGGENNEVCTNGDTRSCTTELVGICSTGSQTCSNNAWGNCIQDNQATTEICDNNIDEDCDGNIDEDCDIINNDSPVILYQNCANGSCSGSGSNTGWVRTVETNNCYSGECLKLAASYNSGTKLYGAGSTSISASGISGKNEITIQYYLKYSESVRTLKDINIKSIRPYVGDSSHYFIATIAGWWGKDFYISYNKGTLDPSSIFDPYDYTDTYSGDTRYTVPNNDGTWDIPKGLIVGNFNQGDYDGFGTQWTKITQWIKLPTTPSGNNGESKLWINNELAFHLYDASMSSGSTSTFSGFTFYPSSEAEEPFEHWMDEMIIYEGYVPPSNENISIQECTNGQTKSCSTNLNGICSTGTQTCSNNAWRNCIQDNQAITEICDNNLDDDCDGNIDEECNISEPSNIYQAEDGIITSPMSIIDNYIQTNTGESGNSKYTINVEQEGNYSLVGHVYAPDMSSDSFYVSINNGENFIWDLNPEINNYNVWKEDNIAKRGTGSTTSPESDPYIFYLNKGDNTIKFSGRESGARLDYFYLTPISLINDEEIIECIHDSDIEPCDGIIDFDELLIYFEKWIKNEVNLQNLINAVNLWENN